MPVIGAILPEYYPGGWHAHSMDAHPSIIRAALLAECSSECDSLPQTGRQDVAQGLKCVLRPCGEPWRGTEALQPASHMSLHSPWLSLPPSISSSLRFCPPGHPGLPFPILIQMLADAKWYLQPPKASAGDVKGVTQIGPGACGWWAQWEPGWAELRSGVPRACWDSQVLPRHSSFSTSSPFPCSKDRVRTQTLKFKAEKKKKESKRKEPRWALQHPTPCCHSYMPSCCSLFSSQSEPMPLLIPRKTFCSALKAKANTWPVRGSSLFSSWSLF